MASYIVESLLDGSRWGINEKRRRKERTTNDSKCREYRDGLIYAYEFVDKNSFRKEFKTSEVRQEGDEFILTEEGEEMRFRIVERGNL